MATVLVQWTHDDPSETGFRLYKVHKTAVDASLTTGALVEAAAGGTDMAEGVSSGTGLVLVTGGSGTSWSYSDTVDSPNDECYYSVRAYNSAGNSAPASSQADATTDFIHVSVTH